MRNQRRITVCLESSLRTAVREKAATTGKSVSAIVTCALEQCLAEDADDLAAFEQRKAEVALKFSAVMKKLQQRKQS